MFHRLHTSLMYVCSDKGLTVTLEQLPKTVIDHKQLTKYIQYQADFKERVTLLKSGTRERPMEPHADRNMPPIMKKWVGLHTLECAHLLTPTLLDYFFAQSSNTQKKSGKM